MVALISIILSLSLIILTAYLLAKFRVIKKQSVFSFITWNLLFTVVGLYSLSFNQNLEQWAELWFIFAFFYYFIYELELNPPEIT